MCNFGCPLWIDNNWHVHAASNMKGVATWPHHECIRHPFVWCTAKIQTQSGPPFAERLRETVVTYWTKMHLNIACTWLAWRARRSLCTPGVLKGIHSCIGQCRRLQFCLNPHERDALTTCYRNSWRNWTLCDCVCSNPSLKTTLHEHRKHMETNTLIRIECM